MPYDNDNDQMPYDNDNDQMPYDNDNDRMPYDNDNDRMPYECDNDNDTATREMKSDGNMTDELKEVGTKDKVPYKREDNMMTKVKWSIETSDVDNDFMREYDNMCKSMEDRQINDFYEARRHIQSAMMGDTPVKTGQNRQCIDNVSDYDREHHRIFKSVRHRLDLGPNMLQGAQQHTTVEPAAALKIQDKIEGKYNENIQYINGQYRNEMYKRADETYTYENPNNYYHNAPGQSRGHRPFNGQGGNQQFRWFTQRNRGQRPQYSQCQFQNYRYQRGASQQNCTQYGNNHKPYFPGNQTNGHRSQGCSRGPQHFRGHGLGRANYQNSNGAYQYQYYMHDSQPEQYGPPCSLCGGFNHSPKHCYKGEHDINNIMEKMSINPRQFQQSNLYQ